MTLKYLLIAIALIAICVFAYKRRQAKLKAKTNQLDYPLVESLIKNVKPEIIESIQISDVTAYFRMLNLKKGVDVPFMYHIPDSNGLVLATYSETNQTVENLKYIQVAVINDDIKNVLGDQRLVVLN